MYVLAINETLFSRYLNGILLLYNGPEGGSLIPQVSISDAGPLLLRLIASKIKLCDL